MSADENRAGVEESHSDSVAWQVGYDHAKFGLRRDTTASQSFLAGFDAFRGRPKKSSLFVKKWLYLRLSALKRGRVLAGDVTPQFLKEIVPDRCPVSLEPLSVAERGRLNWSVDRLENTGAYARANVVVLAQRVNEAKGELGFPEVLDVACREQAYCGLEAIEWARLASLMYGAWCSAFNRDEPYVLPLAASLPAHTLATTTQCIQFFLMRFVTVPGLWDGRLPWREISRNVLGSAEAYDELLEQVRVALAGRSHPFDIWLDKPLFTAFYEWYSRCKPMLDPEVKELLAGRLPGEGVVRELLKKWSLETNGYRPV